MMSTSSHAQRFVAHLERLNVPEKRAGLAALRRGLGRQPGEAPEMFPYVSRWVPEPRSSPTWSEQVYYLVASLYAFHPVGWERIPSKPYGRNLGASLANLNDERGGRGVERRFIALLNSHRDELPEHLRQNIGLLRSGKRNNVDWERLLNDLLHWDDPSRRVQRAWAGSFWGNEQLATEAEQGTPSGQATDSAPTDEESEGSE